MEDCCRRAGWKASVSHLKHLGFYRVDYEGGVFAQRPEIGAVAGPLPGGRRFRSGIYLADGRMLYEGLRKGFSGPMHRAALQQDVRIADLRGMKVRPVMEPIWRTALERMKGSREEDVFAQSAAFCKEMEKRGLTILWDPQGPCA